MVYGFGTKEYVATGYKAELVSGYSWGEFDDAVYLGIGFRMGGFKRFGYLMGGIHPRQLSTTAPEHGTVVQWMWCAVVLESADFPSQPHPSILALNYTQGWNRKSGYEESIGFTDENGLQALDQYAIGTNRMVLNTETVMFTRFNHGDSGSLFRISRCRYAGLFSQPIP